MVIAGGWEGTRGLNGNGKNTIKVKSKTNNRPLHFQFSVIMDNLNFHDIHPLIRRKCNSCMCHSKRSYLSQFFVHRVWEHAGSRMTSQVASLRKDFARIRRKGIFMHVIIKLSKRQ